MTGVVSSPIRDLGRNDRWRPGLCLHGLDRRRGCDRHLRHGRERPRGLRCGHGDDQRGRRVHGHGPNARHVCQQEEGKEPWPEETLVTLKLTPIPQGTHVALIHSDFEKLPQAIAEAERDDHIIGWERSQALPELKKLVETED